MSGPLEVTADGAVIEVGGARLRALLGRLAVAAGRVVTIEELADALWPEDRPADEVAAVRSPVSFAVGHVAGLDEIRPAVVEDGAAADLACGRAEHPVAELTDLATRHPLRERLQALLLRALVASGRAAEALACFEEIRRRFAAELRADPVGLADLPRAGDLRAPLTSLVGRSADVDRIVGQLAEHRLVTPGGPGGAGTTRLATTVAARLPGGAWLVELASVTDPDDVAPAVLGALGRPPPWRWPTR